MNITYKVTFFSLLLPLGLGGCTNQGSLFSASKKAASYKTVNNTLYGHVALADLTIEKDRAAILAMQGEYKVDFNFNETVILDPEYEYFPPKKAGAYETVFVVENTPERIILQHVLVVGDNMVVKHWRQDWFFEAKKRFEFTSNQKWTLKDIKPENHESYWTQCVYEVSDAPRYCGTGLWNHRNDASTWTSDRSWRPLPRREYTVRDDYNALDVENRHTVTSNGWTHEQDNTKVKRSGEAIQTRLVREFGFNNYRNITGYDFSPAYDYWEKTSSYWAIVRAAWSERFQQKGYVELHTDIDGMPIIDATFAHAQAIEDGEPTPDAKAVEEVLTPWVNVSSEQDDSLSYIDEFQN